MTDVIAITGGASGIGLACAEACLAKGWAVAIGDLDETALDVVRKRFAGQKATFEKCDVSDEASVRAWLKNAAAQGRLAGVVNAAGIGGAAQTAQDVGLVE